MELISLCRFWHCCKFMCSILSKATQPVDFIKPNIIQKLANKVKYINQINGGLIIFFFFFKNSRIRFFYSIWLNCEQ